MTGRRERARETAASIEGWLTDAEGELLFRLASECPPGAPIVEIGSWKGKSTVWLACGVRDAGATQVFAIDPHQHSLEDPEAKTLDDLHANIARADVAAVVVPIVAASHTAAAAFARQPGVVFVDGNHLEDAVRADLADWFPKLLNGGVLALHDVLNERWSGPRRALRAMLWRSTEITAVEFVDSIAWMTKVGRNSARDRRRNRLAALLLIAYEIKTAHPPRPVLAILRSIYSRTLLKRSMKTRS